MTTEFFRECITELPEATCQSQNFALEMKAAGYPSDHYNSIMTLPDWALQGQAHPSRADVSQASTAMPQPPQGLPMWLLFGVGLGLVLAIWKGR